ncbi:Pr6Pr family membrane protein [Demequina sp.]|uniref:Pr6Pr family membrane protein n=1 Tax=Demequina sp. TaxID=2050685 RepID=UPI0025FFFF4F|nr:Pr6Pr family membrane protein [Demequina sp.]
MRRFVIVMRVIMMVLIVTALVATLTDVSGRVPDSYIDLVTYFTLQVNVACLGVWGALTWHAVRRSTPAPWVEYGRAFIAANLAIVAVIYWGSVFPLGTQDGPQLAWVMVISHVVTPLYVIADQALVGTRRPLPWRHLWIVSGYATLYVGLTLGRGAIGGWVPYDYLKADAGYGPVVSTVLIHGTLLVVFSAVAMRWRSARRIADPSAVPVGEPGVMLEPARARVR